MTWRRCVLILCFNFGRSVCVLQVVMQVALRVAVQVKLRWINERNSWGSCWAQADVRLAWPYESMSQHT